MRNFFGFFRWGIVACWVTIRSLLLLAVVFAAAFMLILVLSCVVLLFTRQFSWSWPLIGAMVITVVVAHVAPFVLELHQDHDLMKAQLATFYGLAVLTAVLSWVWGFDPLHLISLGTNLVAFIAIPSIFDG